MTMKKRIHAFQIVAFVLVALLGVASAHAQTSFGRMRDAAEKGGTTPALDDENGDAFNVSPDSKNNKKTKPTASTKPRVKPDAKSNGAASVKNAKNADAQEDETASELNYFFNFSLK